MLVHPPQYARVGLELIRPVCFHDTRKRVSPSYTGWVHGQRECTLRYCDCVESCPPNLRGSDKLWRSLAARLLRVQEVAGSNPASLTGVVVLMVCSCGRRPSPGTKGRFLNARAKSDQSQTGSGAPSEGSEPDCGLRTRRRYTPTPARAVPPLPLSCHRAYDLWCEGWSDAYVYKREVRKY